MPHVQCGHCGIGLVDVPWARPGSGFTLLFEALVTKLANAIPVKTPSEYVGEYDARLWRIIHHYVDQGCAGLDHSTVEKIGLDETTSKRGHKHVSLSVDLADPDILFATEGRCLPPSKSLSRI